MRARSNRPDEIAGMTHALAVCDGGIARMREALQPGMTENALWALLHETNIRHGGECIETRLFASGGRTNPWFQECSDRVIRPGDLVAFDTDMIGPMGFCCDISRTFHTGPGKASPTQRKLYALAVEQIRHNLGLLKAGVRFREITEKSFMLPEPYYPNRYANVMHGVGLADEWPVIVNRSDWDTRGYDGVLEEGMVLSVESYVGATGGVDGIKLEECALVTRDGYQLLSTFPYEERLVGLNECRRAASIGHEGTRPLGGTARSDARGGRPSSCSAPRSILVAPADAVALRAYRRNRIRTALGSHDLAAIVLFNPINIRYACDARNMQVYGLHNPCRYVCMTADGHTTLFEFRNCEHLSRHLETVDEIRPAKAWYHMAAGPNAAAAASAFAREIAALVRERGGGGRIAFDRLDPAGAAALAAEGLVPVDGLALLDFARAIKSADEIKAMSDAIRACEEGLRRMQAAHRPGITEQALWSVLCQANAELGGEWMETRLLSAGARTNPWYNECGEYVIQPGDLVSFDTDLVGRHGYSVDLSRSWLTDGAHGDDEQRTSLRARPRAGPSQHRDSRARPHVPRGRGSGVPASRALRPADEPRDRPRHRPLQRVPARREPRVHRRRLRRRPGAKAWCCASRATSASPAAATASSSKSRC